jgi:hypothetical protein
MESHHVELHRRARRTALMVLLSLAPLAAGCYKQQAADPNAEPAAVTRVRVQNQAFLDMTIYVYRGPQRVRLGVANGNSTTRFTVPSNMIFGATPLRFQAHPIGSNRQSISEEITVSPGDEVTLRIPPQ